MPVVYYSTIRIVLELLVQRKPEMLQIDVNSSFLNGCFKKDIYIAQKEVFESKGKERMLMRPHMA